MPQAVVNPEELERFSQQLQHFSDRLKQQTAILNAGFSQLGSTWRDQEHQKFAHEYQQTMQVINKFIDTTDAHVPFLLRKAKRVRDYLNQA
ncbi:MAG TPA: hypothetical protein DCR55_14910 [Lentisphaeria bacterium]|jgi:uncharacterized protein YukE|nr:hypothetical protein [Lentisphaeria bacterium]